MTDSTMMKPGEGQEGYSALRFAVQQMLSKVQTATLVKVVSVTNAGGVSPVGFVDVQPLVNILDAAGNGYKRGVLHNLPYLRIQGGADAVILDPKAGDIGIAVFASRDISTVKQTRARANPGSWATHSESDGMYLGGVLNGVPSQWIRFSDEGIEIHSPIAIKLNAPVIEFTGNVQVDGNVGVNGSLLNNGTNVGSTHVHGGIQPGSSNTATPH